MQYDRFAAVILDKGLDQPLDYGVHVPVHVGTRVLVPVQNSFRKGTIIALKDKPSVSKVQPIKEVLSEESLISPELFALAEWMARYYCTSFRKALKVLLPATIRKETQEKKQLFVRRLLTPKQMGNFAASIRSKHPAQAKVLDILIKKPKGIFLTELLELSKTSKSPVTNLEKQKVVEMPKEDRAALIRFLESL